MRKLTTGALELYYPAHLKGPALRMAARLEGCVARLRGQTASRVEQPRLLVYLTSANFNNAYVVPDFASIPQQMVLPVHVSLELFHLFGLGEVAIGDVACHEAVHYVQLQQTRGLWGFLNTITGGLFQPNSFTESWFLEGLATYYEGRFEKDTGRPHSPVWRGWYESVVQAKGGGLDPGYLSPEHRALDPFGGNYLVGMHFVEYLAGKYGEEKLWKLVDEQASSILPPLAVTLRFKRVYGRDIGSLFDEYQESLKPARVARERPASQQVWLKDAGYFSRLAVHGQSGVSALLAVGREESSRLTVREPDGKVRFERPLVELWPGRDWVLGSPSLVSGMSFSRDGAWLYLVMADVNAETSFTARLWRVDARTGDVTRTWDGVQGMGGSVTPEGSAYVYVEIQDDTANLMRLELETGRKEALTRFDAGMPVAPPDISPDGQRMVFPMGGKLGWDLVLREADGSLRWLTRDGFFNYSPRWLDGERIVFLREHEGRLQAHVMTVATREVTRITDAPHLVMDVSPLGTDQVAFLNRDGTGFTLDRAPVAPVAQPEAPAAPEVPARAEAEAPAPPLVPATPEVPAQAAAPAPAPATPEAPAPATATPEAPAQPAPDSQYARFPGDPTPPAPARDAPPPPESPAAPVDAPVAVAAQEEPVGVLGADPGTSLPVTSDEPYSTLEGFFIPEFRLPYLLFASDAVEGTDDTETRVTAGVALAGQDRLGFHGYALTLTYDSTQDAPNVSLAYGNALLAPWYLQVSGARIVDGPRTDLQATAFGSRTFWTTPVTVGLLALRREYEPYEQVPGGLVTRLIGPEVSASYFAGDSTSYGGTQRGFGVTGAAGVYPGAFFRDSTMGDLRLGLDGFLGGLPFTGRDNLHLTAVGRFLPGSPDGLLEVGGISAGQVWYSNRRSRQTAPLPLELQPGVAFSEYVRGLEDFTVLARSALIGTATYRYRQPIDYGWASTLWLLPSLFISDFEVEGFGTLARTDLRENFRAVGGSASLHLTLGQAIPLSFFYQYAYRFDRGLGHLHLVGLGL
ncbi:MAG TPA: hypothetical protein VE153_06200 [Myxococcus sp.]|nr:hypothetical protein [Myxococcus sp.]